MNLESLLAFSVVLSLALSALYCLAVIRTQKNFAPNTILVAILISQLLNHGLVYMEVARWISPQSLLYGLYLPFKWISYPLLYLYVRALGQRNFQLSQIHSWHILPFFLGLLWYGVVHYWDLDAELLTPSYLWERYLRVCFGLPLLLGYLIAARKEIQAFEAQAKENHSSLIDLRLHWLKYLYCICIAGVLLNVTDVLTGPGIPLWMVSSLLSTTGLLGLTYFGLHCCPILIEEWKLSQQGLLTEAELKKFKMEVPELIKSKGLFLQPQVRLSDIAADLQIKKYKLSLVFNQGLGINFFDFINGLRIEKAQELLQDQAYNHMNLLGIAMECGFNSKSTFNDSFRRQVGVTPSQFRKNPKNIAKMANSDV